ncbi:MAG: hypothetical protein CM15mP121_0180 [Bacteroidota bacterium]|nr:MAG: hypothetical protein CM15mP121_0180 [Bacteroidota bacterium]
MNNFIPNTFSSETIEQLKSFYSIDKWQRFGSDYRIIFDWNDPFAEFNIQFVDPSKSILIGPTVPLKIKTPSRMN